MTNLTRSRLLATAALFAAATAVPASAEWRTLGTVDVPDEYATTHVRDVPVHVDRLSFKADSDVRCSNIRVEYETGYTQELYSGTLYGGQEQTVYFPEGSRNVRDVALDCRSEDGGPARIALAAQTGYRIGDSRFVPAPLHRGLVPVANREFGGTADRLVMLPSALPADQIAIEPVGGDAHCTRLSAKFDNGDSHDVVPNDGYRLHEGTIYRIDVSDHPKDLNGIEMTCRATDTDTVNIRVFTSA